MPRAEVDDFQKKMAQFAAYHAPRKDVGFPNDIFLSFCQEFLLFELKCLNTSILSMLRRMPT